jgi:hypothetical protein
MTQYYDDWQGRRYECSRCGWIGTGQKLARGESFDALFELNCPVCDKRVATVSYPTIEQSRENWDKLSDADKAVVEYAEAVEAGGRQSSLPFDVPIKQPQAEAETDANVSDSPACVVTATVEVRRGFRTYVVELKLTDDQSISLVSAKRQGASSLPVRSSVASELYMKVLRTPHIRAEVLEQLIPDKTEVAARTREDGVRKRAENHAFAAGFGVFLLTGAALYAITLQLADWWGMDTAMTITYLPSFFAVLIILPVKNWYERWFLRRHCQLAGHLPRPLVGPGREIIICDRCHELLNTDHRKRTAKT